MVLIQVPIYKGADRPMIAAFGYNPNFNATETIAALFGYDGMGANPEFWPKVLESREFYPESGNTIDREI